MRWRQWAAVVSLVLVDACSSGPDTNGQSSGSASTAPTASANASLQGDAGLAASFTQPDVRCSFPDVDGPSIALLSTPPGLVYRIKVLQGKVTVLVSDTATPSHARQFTGTGVTSFDSATGAHVESTLTEIPTTEGPPGQLGELTAIKASIDCAGQDPGTSTVTLTGDTPQGALAGESLGTARVECYTPGNEVSVVGIVTINGVNEFMVLGLGSDGVSVNKMMGDAAHQYQSPPGAATVTDTGAHVNGDAAGTGAAAPHVLHVEGDVRCGTPVG